MTDILTILAECRNGAVAIDISNKFTELVKSVVDTNGKGDLTIKLSLKSNKKRDGTVEMSIDYDGKIKRPELPMGTSVFFVAPDGQTLSRTDPRQEEMFDTRGVDGKTAATGEKRNG